MTDARYALYFAPALESELARFGDAWLGRSAATGGAVARFPVPDVAPAWLDKVTESPRFYGFHGTLKPPFGLAGGRTEAHLRDAAAAFAAQRPRFDMPPLSCQVIGSFIALIPSQPCPDLEDLAAACVREIDPLRAPPSETDLVKRRARGLTEAQEACLIRWGYPYVMEEFRFHLTLSGSLMPADRTRLLSLLRDLTAPLCRDPVTVGELCLFTQPDRQTPFTILERFPLAED